MERSLWGECRGCSLRPYAASALEHCGNASVRMFEWVVRPALHPHAHSIAEPKSVPFALAVPEPDAHPVPIPFYDQAVEVRRSARSE